MAIVNTEEQFPQQQQNKQNEQKSTPSQSGWFNNAGLFAAPISRGVGSEFYSKLKTNLTEVYKQSNENVEVALIDLDNVNEPALAFSCIVVALRYKKQMNDGVSYHILILEATGDKISSIFDNINSQQVEVMRVTSDALDDILLTKALEKVRKAFPTGPWYMVDGCVVPANFNPDDKFAVHRLALNAGLACGTELEIRNPDFRDLNLVAAGGADSNLTITIGFQHQQIEDAVSNPMRSDMLINFASKRTGQQGKYTSVNSGDKEVKVSEISGFLDLIWNPVNPMGVFNPWSPVQPTQTQKYMARMVITNLASSRGYTPGSVLLALATSLSLRDNNNWIQAFRPTPTSSNEIDMTDIGALNIEANLSNEPSGFGTRIDTKADNFKLEDLGQLVSALIQPGLIVSLDCPESGPQAWYLSVFASAANGSQAAYRVIYQAAEQLTNGNFSKYFPQGSPMFVDIGNRVHLGTWVDRSGNKRDIRDIDHVAVCNLAGDRNPSVIRDWSDSFLLSQYPLPLRLAGRKKIISALTNETANFTGFAQRVTFSSAFMEALSKGIKETGLPVRVNTPLSGSDFSNQRGVANFAGSALLAPGQSFMQAGGYGYQQQFANQGTFNGRW